MQSKTLSVPIPREHGSWAMWILPFFAAAAITGFPARQWLLLGCVFFAYLTLAPIELLEKSGVRRRENTLWLLLYIAFSGICGVWLLPHYPGLLLFPVIAFISFLINYYFIRHRAERHLLNDFTGILTLCCTFLAAYYVGANHVGTDAVVDYLYFVAFYFGSALHIKSRIRQRFQRRYKWVSMGYSALLLAAFLLLHLPILISVGQAIALLRTVFLPQAKKPRIALIAATEIVTSLAFSGLLVAALWPH